MTTETEVIEHRIEVCSDGKRYWRSCCCGYESAHFLGEASEADTRRPCPRDKTVDGLVTLQFGPVSFDGYRIHLVRHSRGGGTPGPALCGIDRFADDGPGWSVGGGTGGTHTPCAGCAEAARSEFPGLPVTGEGAKEMGGLLGVRWSHWNGGEFWRGLTASLREARRQLDIAQLAAEVRREKESRITGLLGEVHAAVSEGFDACDEADRRYEDLLGSISLYVPWRYVTKQLTTEQKDMWADAVEAWSARLNADDDADQEPPAKADRWWRDA